jgi:L-rhamnose mutarotase
MDKYAWTAKILEGKKEEYIRRHNEIWPEMVKMLKEAGICNYTIWATGNTLFGYYECEKGIEFCSKVQSNSEICKKCNEYIKEVLYMPLDPDTGAQPKLTKVFSLD